MYEPEQVGGEAAEGQSDAEIDDIEAEIKKELADIRKPSAKPLFTSVKLDTQCCKQDPSISGLDLTYPSDLLQDTRADRARGVC
jgi:hypothetical protein|tara:strand:+ start:3398 stop:3649 length:252 start_codon:yes stop_codon:yes gene_type:complete